MNGAGLRPTWNAYFVSDSTGVTAETLGNALLVNFPDLDFVRRTIPFVDTETQARAFVERVAREEANGFPTIVFATVKRQELRAILAESDANVIDLLAGHLTELETALGTPAADHPSRFTRTDDIERYYTRVRAVEFAIEHDDGQTNRALDQAQVIIIAPSRCGKTPTTMYLALQYGLLVANYPLTDDDFPSEELPAYVRPYASKCFGLTTNPKRLSEVRNERRPNSNYASLEQCTLELRRAEDMYRQYRIPYMNSATKSVEEMSAVIMQTMRLRA